MCKEFPTGQNKRDFLTGKCHLYTFFTPEKNVFLKMNQGYTNISKELLYVSFLIFSSV